MSLNSVAVVILNWNGKHFLEKFLPSLIEHTSFAELIVADNCSTDDSLSFLKENFPQIRIITLSENYGFAKGYNEALKQVNSDVYVLLNSDVEVTENWLQPCLDVLEKDNDVAACQPKIKAFHQKTHFEYAGAAGGFMDKYGYPFCRGRIFETLEEDKGQYNDEIDIFWATGACLVVRAGVYHQLNGLDPFFFAHMEEIDLCWRIQNIGKKIKYVPQSTVFHVGGGTLHKSKPQKTFLNFRNNLIMLYKNLPQGKKFGVLIGRLFLDGLAGIKFLTEGKISHFTAIIKAHFAFYAYMFKNTEKPIKTSSIPNTIYPKSILYHYFVKKEKKYSDLS